MFRLFSQYWPLSFASLSVFFATSLPVKFLLSVAILNSCFSTVCLEKVGSTSSINKCLCQPIGWSMAAMLRDSVVVVRTRQRAIPLAMITMRKSTRGLPSLSHDALGPPKLRY